MSKSAVGWLVSFWCGVCLGSVALIGSAIGSTTDSANALAFKSAQAQTATDRAEEAVDIIDRVVVTSSRVQTPLAQTAQAVSVLDREDLATPNLGLGLDEWLNRVPGVFFQNRYNFAQNIRISTRGFGARSPFGVRGIQLLTDGFPDTLPDGQAQVDSVDLQSLVGAEVLRGPASVLYGNASGGVIALFTEDGEGLTPAMRAHFGYGSDGFMKRGLEAGGQWDVAHGWLSVSDLEYEGQRDHSGTSKRLLNANGALSIDPSQRLQLAIAVLDQPFGNDAGALTRAQVDADRWQASQQSESLNAGQTVRQERLGLRHELDLSEDTLWSSYAFRASRDFEQQLPSSFFPSLIAFQRAFYGMGGALRISQINDWRLTAGFDWARQDDDRQRYRVNAEGLVIGQTQNERQLAKSQALYFQAHRRWKDWSFLAGLRYDDLRLSIDEKGVPDAPRTGREFNEWSLMAGATYSFSPRLTGFLNWGEGFESPTFTEIKDLSGAGGFARALSPANAENHEFGLRGFWDRGQIEASVFWVDTRNEILVTDSFDGVDIFANAGQTDRLGLEFALEHALSESLQLSMAYTYADYQFEKFVVDGERFDGKALPGLPRHSLYSQARWQLDNAWSLYLDGLWVGPMYADNANTERVSSYGLINWRAEFAHDLKKYGRLIWSVGINNAFNQDYFSNVRVNANRGAYFEPGPARAWFARLSWQR